MRTRNSLSLVLAVVAPLLLVESAQAYFHPGTGRFISRDPYFERGGTNIYAYVRNRPTFAIDPFGLQESQPTSKSCCYCGPDVTDFFAGLVNDTLKWRRGLGAVSRRDGLAWLRANGMNLDWDARVYKVDGCPSGDKCKNTYWLCDECVHDHWIGNFMYGFLAKLFWIPDAAANAAGNAVQGPGPGDPAGSYTDPPWDTAGYDLARKLADAIRNGKDKFVSADSLCKILKSDATLWGRANDTSAKPPEGTKYPTPRSSGYKDCAKCPTALPANIGSTFPGGSLGGSWPPVPHDVPGSTDDPRFPLWPW